MNRRISLAMVAAIALTAGLVLVLGNTDQAGRFAYGNFHSAPQSDNPEAAVRIQESQEPYVATNVPHDAGLVLEDVTEILSGLARAESTTTSTTVPATETTTPKATPSTTKPKATSTKPKSAPTTTKPKSSPPSTVKAEFRSDFESEFLSLINSYRASHGLDPLTRNSSLDSRARDWSKKMAAAGNLSHSNLSSLFPPWSKAAENIGRGSSVTGLFNALKNSSGHSKNMLGDFTHIGIGVWRASNGQLWTTHVFTR